MAHEFLATTELGKQTVYPEQYDPSLLLPIPRAQARAVVGLERELPFSGVDIWNAYELSWLDPWGKPHIAALEFHIPASSKNLIESKSFKLYLNSFAGAKIYSEEILLETIRNDVAQAASGEVTVKLFKPDAMVKMGVHQLPGINIDSIGLAIDTYQPHPEYLTTETEAVHEQLNSHLFKSNCPVTNQPDWASVWIHYRGKKINREGLLRYLISYRGHQAFHEQCAEQIFCDIQHYCAPEQLTVYLRFTRRGGLDINPFRSNFENHPKNWRMFWQ